MAGLSAADQAGLSSADLAARIAALEAALYAGERRVTYGSGEAQVTAEFRDVAELARALEMARARLAELTGAGQALQVSVARWTRA